MNRVLQIIFLFYFTVVIIDPAKAQYGGDYEYSTEMIWGITKATNSGLIGGFMFKYAKELKEDRFHGAMIEIVNVKHPQEQKYFASESGNMFIWGKEHYLYSLRLSYLREYTFFKKAAQQGVQVSGILAAGPTLGFEAPYYVEKRKGQFTVKEQHDPVNDQFSNILGTGNILQGVGESSVVPGLNLKVGMAFEFGAFKSNVVGVEVGFQCDFFTREIILMPTTDNSSYFPSAYATLFYGSRR